MTDKHADSVLVSVVIPMFQAEAWILDTLATVSQQTYPHIETVVVDDGSSDRGADLVVEFRESNSLALQLVQTQNRGVSAARNTGIAESTGELVAFLDADDLWHPQKIEMQVERLAATGSPLCSCSYEIFNCEADRTVGVVRVLDGSQALRAWLALEGNGLALASTALVRRSVLHELNQFDPRLKRSADLDFALRVSEMGQMDAVPEVLVRYRVHPDQMHRQLSGLSESMSYLFDRVFSDGQDWRFERRCRANLEVHVGLTKLFKGHCRASLWHLAHSLRWDPSRIVMLPLRVIARRLGRRGRVLFQKRYQEWTA